MHVVDVRPFAKGPPTGTDVLEQLAKVSWVAFWLNVGSRLVVEGESRHVENSIELDRLSYVGLQRYMESAV